MPLSTIHWNFIELFLLRDFHILNYVRTLRISNLAAHFDGVYSSSVGGSGGLYELFIFEILHLELNIGFSCCAEFRDFSVFQFVYARTHIHTNVCKQYFWEYSAYE